jgi:hypothetical protein
VLHKLRTRPSSAILAAASATVFAASLAGASTAPGRGVPPPPPPDSSAGTVGSFGWRSDTEARPAGACRYGHRIDGTYFNHLKKVGADAPVAFAHEGRNRQRIGVRLTVQKFDGGVWADGKHSDWSKETATPEERAPFKPLGLAVPFDSGSAATRRAKVELRWYNREGDVAGRATMYPDFYEAVEKGRTHTQAGDCGGTTG